MADRDADESELVALDAHMARTVYVARNALTAAASRERRLRQDIRQALRTPAGMGTLIEDLAAGSLQKDLPREYLTATTRVLVRALPPLDLFMADRTNPRREEEALRSNLRQRRAEVLPVVWPIPGRGEWVIQLHTSEGMPRDAAQGLCAVMERLQDYRVNVASRLTFLQESDLQDLLLGPIARDLIAGALAILFGSNVRWEWGISAGPQAVFAPRARARELVTEEIRRTVSGPNPSARRAELDLLYNMLLGDPRATALVAVANLRGFIGENRIPALELDCLVIEERHGRLVARLGEAKTGMGSVNAARSHFGTI